MLWKILSATALAACLGLAASAGAPQPRDDVFYCDRETTKGKIEQYFARLKVALRATGPKSRFNEFVAPRFLVIDERGRDLEFDLEDFNSITPGRIRLADWREISARGPDEVDPIGWRGCMMNHGKVWFESNDTKGLQLRGFDRSRVWEPIRRR
jgi:hypothetical protein